MKDLFPDKDENRTEFSFPTRLPLPSLEKYPNGTFARLNDPEGNPIQLWEPSGTDSLGASG